jgi:hypothetical protein
MSRTWSLLGEIADVHPSNNGCEDWWFCHLDDLAFALDGAPTFAHT